MINIDAWDRKCDDLNKALSKNKKLKEQLKQADEVIYQLQLKNKELENEIDKLKTCNCRECRERDD